MRTHIHRRLITLCLCLGVLGHVDPLHAQSNPLYESRCGSAPSTTQVFSGAVDGFKRLRSRESVTLLAIGGAVAAGTHPADREVTEEFGHPGSLRNALRPGAVIGGTPLEFSAAFATYWIGRATHHSCVATLGADLVKAQLVAEGLTIGVKELAHRSRPQGAGLSFPSGHTAAAFASATVLQQHFGWKVGVPAYAVATYVGASRVQMQKHYLSDVAFGAAVGLVAGRNVTIGSNRFLISPIAADHGGGIGLTWAGKK